MRGGRGVFAALLAGAVIAACTDVSTDPQVPVSLQFDSLPALAVVVGDTLRDGSLNPVRIPVMAFSGSGSIISDSALRVIGTDTASAKAFAVLPGLLLKGTTVNSAVRIVAQAGALQSQPQTFAVVPAPTSIVRDSVTATDSILSLVSVPIAAESAYVAKARAVVRVRSGTTAVNGLRVAFRIVSFPTTLVDSMRLVQSPTGVARITNSALMRGDTATIHMQVFGKKGVAGTGSVVLEASIKALGVPVPGSPLTITMKLVQL